VRVLVASTFVPFIEGDTIEIPYLSHWEEMLDQMLALRLIDVSEDADVLVAIRPPSYLLNHPNKRLWFIHHHRGAYDLWGTPWQDPPSTPEGLAMRDAIHGSDNIYLREAQRIFTNSQIVADRLRKFNDLEGTVLYPPLGHPERFYSGAAEDFVFYPCRITSHKRQMLAIEAAVHLSSDVRVVIAGAPDHPSQLAPLREFIREHQLEQRVELIPRWISEEEKAELIARSVGVLYIPFDEDSYGYVTLEAFHARKPVITCRDSGGTLEIIENDLNGFIVDPDAVSLARAIDALRSDPARAAAMGENAHRVLLEKSINWDSVVDSLLG
jgi:glycosyltransferase involved in cell wall biosynthesis